MLRVSICAVTEEFSGCSRLTSILPLNLVNFPCVVPRNCCTLKPIVEPDGSNLYVSFANTAELKLTTATTATRLGNFISNSLSFSFSPPSPVFSRAAYGRAAIGRTNFPKQKPDPLSVFSRRALRQSAPAPSRNAKPHGPSDRLYRDNQKPGARA